MYTAFFSHCSLSVASEVPILRRPDQIYINAFLSYANSERPNLPVYKAVWSGPSSSLTHSKVHSTEYFVMWGSSDEPGPPDWALWLTFSGLDYQYLELSMVPKMFQPLKFLSTAVAYLCVISVQHFLYGPHGEIYTGNFPVKVPFNTVIWG